MAMQESIWYKTSEVVELDVPQEFQSPEQIEKFAHLLIRIVQAALRIHGEDRTVVQKIQQDQLGNTQRVSFTLRNSYQTRVDSPEKPGDPVLLVGLLESARGFSGVKLISKTVIDL